ncbi:DUF6542 domain-containing protein [Sphaerisporangium sp. TRM90804]|uniref:DUF6542 domain-containing protein n=1 Tax=Sphaerisporangium sp. TRM90804 TaxID=3031113 RepID=UPI00244B3E3C|nr:DUF6542 domain-containing protein [Sphaerisporangium sp. TRM90804]MDH2428860.1 hypothetical protein [Sphaerisporangium sp. TRM90804]
MVTPQGTRPGVRLTARGAIALVFAVTLVSQLAGSTTVVGLAFGAACLAAVLLVQPRDLLSLVVTPPLVFFAATLTSAVAGALGAPSLVQALGLGLVTALSAGAPWLFAGSALVLAVAWFRGLPANVRELRDELRAGRSPAAPGAAAPAGAKRDVPVFAPEPEGYFEPRVYGSPREPQS